MVNVVAQAGCTTKTNETVAGYQNMAKKAVLGGGFIATFLGFFTLSLFFPLLFCRKAVLLIPHTFIPVN